MKKMTNPLISFLILMGLLAPALPAETLDRIVAIVDSDIITLGQLMKETEPYKKNMESSGYSDEKKKALTDELNRKLLGSLIDQSLTQQEAKKYNIEISEMEIDGAIENVRRIKSLSREDLEKAIGQEGLTYKEYRETIRKQILQARLINFAVKSKVVITEAEIKRHYEANIEKYAVNRKYHLKNILMNDKAKMDEIKIRLDNKEDFSALAKQYSMAPNASDGGNLGVFDLGSFSAGIKDSIALLKKGEHTEVIRTTQGFQIFYAQDVEQGSTKTFEQARDEIHEALYQEQVKAKFDTWLESLKKKAHIKILL
ncbi:MAG: SurA N-terminal domain-containing protein [Desulfobacula sp.]|nr:SurA N-terminal domain-containing protein [Desulfobacula sp.]